MSLFKILSNKVECQINIFNENNELISIRENHKYFEISNCNAPLSGRTRTNCSKDIPYIRFNCSNCSSNGTVLRTCYQVRTCLKKLFPPFRSYLQGILQYSACLKRRRDGAI